jgi:hypothetical protein
LSPVGCSDVTALLPDLSGGKVYAAGTYVISTIAGKGTAGYADHNYREIFQYLRDRICIISVSLLTEQETKILRMIEMVCRINR